MTEPELKREVWKDVWQTGQRLCGVDLLVPCKTQGVDRTRYSLTKRVIAAALVAAGMGVIEAYQACGYSWPTFGGPRPDKERIRQLGALLLLCAQAKGKERSYLEDRFAKEFERLWQERRSTSSTSHREAQDSLRHVRELVEIAIAQEIGGERHDVERPA